MGGASVSKCMPQKTFNPDEEGESKDRVGKGPRLAQERAVGLETVAQACRLCKSVQDSLVSEESMTKQDKSPVTVADYASQALIIYRLNKAFPQYPFIAEEDAATLVEHPEILEKVLEHCKAYEPDMTKEMVLEAIGRGSPTQDAVLSTQKKKRWWTLDPIDGTLGFLRRGQYAVALALMEDNQPVLGILGCPSLSLNLKDPESPKGCILVAVSGQGAFQRPIDDKVETPIHVSENSNMKSAIMTESIAHTSPHVKSVKDLLSVEADPLCIDSQCKYACVARGDSEIYLRFSDLKYREKIWDHAAGAIIVQEAGGEVADWFGNPLDWSRGTTLEKNIGIIATNHDLHFACLGAVQRVGAHKGV